MPNVDGHDADAVRRAIDAARAETERPSLICCKTIIGYGAPNVQGTSATHGAALGPAEAAAARKNLGWDEPPFVIPADVKAAWDARERGARLEAEWQTRFAAYRTQHPELAARARAAHERRAARRSGASTRRKPIAAIAAAAKSMATRKASQAALEAFAPALPELVGGSADLTGSNNTLHKYSKPLTPSDAGRQLSLLRRARVRHGRDDERPWPRTAASFRTAARSSCSPTTRATRCACRR